MIMPSAEILVRNLLAQKSYTTIHREGFLFNSYFGQEWNNMKKQTFTFPTGRDGALVVLTPIPLLLTAIGSDDGFPDPWQRIVLIISAIAFFSFAMTVSRRPLTGKILGGSAALGCYSAIFPQIIADPFIALAGTASLCFIVFALIDIKAVTHASIRIARAERSLHQARWAASAAPVVAVLGLIIDISSSEIAAYATPLSSVIAQILFIRWSMVKKSLFSLLVPAVGLVSVTCSLFFSSQEHLAGIVLLISLLSLLVLPRSDSTMEIKEERWEFLLSHPARVLILTFSGLCVIGTVLLLIPISSTTGIVSPIDAVFTSVSAVCVTGLIVLDTPNDFSLFGQISILILIQLGGLGMMSITTVALHAMGRRLSLRQERLLTSITDTAHKDLVKSLVIILQFTFIAEALGALLLAYLFHGTGDTIVEAIWRGVFTAISAFCNAGFALQSDSLMAYRSNHLIVFAVSILIISGGLAPATSLMIPKWLSGKPVSIPSRIALVTTAILLPVGTFCLLVFEWNGILAGLSLPEKLQNAWFQSVTLRTAGFNTVDIADIAGPTFLVMIFFMFIGGSPGGTAGGIKTTTLGLLAMTFWTNITTQSDVVIQKRCIQPTAIYRAITIVAAGFLVWFIVVLMLQATQQIAARDLIFEATSAIGTVGLSTGATSLLDEVGKTIIIIAMFVGRIGPVTLFMVLSNDQISTGSRYPVEKSTII